MYCWHESHQRRFNVGNAMLTVGLIQEPIPLPPFIRDRDAFHCKDPEHESNWTCDDECPERQGQGIHCCEPVAHKGKCGGPNGPCWTKSEAPLHPQQETLL